MLNFCRKNEKLRKKKQPGQLKKLRKVGEVKKIKVKYQHQRKVSMFRAPDKREYWMIIRDNFSYFSSKPYVVTRHLNRLNETIQMRGHNIWFYAKSTKIILNYHQILPLI